MEFYGEWIESTSVRIALIGDSTLDNCVWVQRGEKPIARHIYELVKNQDNNNFIDGGGNSNCALANLSADGFTTQDVLDGSTFVISAGLRSQFDPNNENMVDKLIYDEDGVYRPLNQLEKLDPKPTHIVLSIGGNDIREILGDLMQFPKVYQTFQQNYPNIVQKCCEMLDDSTNLFMMLQYRPCFTTDDSYYGVYQAIGEGFNAERAGMMLQVIKMIGLDVQDLFSGEIHTSIQKLNWLMKIMYGPILKGVARERGLSVMDLPNTFDLFDEKLYNSQIEPSGAGGKLIATIIEGMIRNKNQRSANKCAEKGAKLIKRESLIYHAAKNAETGIYELVLPPQVNSIEAETGGWEWKVIENERERNIQESKHYKYLGGSRFYYDISESENLLNESENEEL